MFNHLAYSINDWVSLAVLTKTRYDLDNPPHDIVNYWLLNISDFTLVI
jgi:hypothetical protein